MIRRRFPVGAAGNKSWLNGPTGSKVFGNGVGSGQGCCFSRSCLPPVVEADALPLPFSLARAVDDLPDEHLGADADTEGGEFH
jgi:hypothetical protein